MWVEDWMVGSFALACYFVPFHHHPPMSREPVELPSYSSGSLKDSGTSQRHGQNAGERCSGDG